MENFEFPFAKICDVCLHFCCCTCVDECDTSYYSAVAFPFKFPFSCMDSFGESHPNRVLGSLFYLACRAYQESNCLPPLLFPIYKGEKNIHLNIPWDHEPAEDWDDDFLESDSQDDSGFF